MAIKKYSGQNGFTIVELLVVIVVIAILAAIVTVAYNGIRQRSTDSVMRADLKQVSKLIENSNTENGTYPAALNSINGGTGYKASGNNSLTYTKLRNGYCISVTNPSASPLYLMSTTGQVANGICELPNTGTVTTLAGNGSTGSNDGPGASATFYMFGGSVFYSDGFLYLTASDNRIRRVASNGTVSTVFTAAQIGSQSFAITADKSGNFYYIDPTQRVQKITPSGTVTTLAGSGSSGYADGVGTAAQFNGLKDITIDDNGNLYVVENQGHRARKITPAGVVTTISDNNGGSCMGHFYPNGIAIDAEGNLYVTDSGCGVINKVSPAGVITRFAGTPGSSGTADGTGASAQFMNLGDITIDQMGTLYVIDDSRIRKITRSGIVTTLAGSSSTGYVDGISSAARFNWPSSLSVDDTGAVYVMDTGNYRVRKIQ